MSSGSKKCIVLMALMVAACAFASTASAAIFTVDSGAGLVASRLGATTFATDSGTIHCEATTYSAGSAEAASIVLTPSYGGCARITSSEFVSVDTNGCKLRLTPSGLVHLFGCTNTGKSISLTLASCTVEIQEQTMSSAVYTSTGAGTTAELTADLQFTNIRYREKGAGCKNPESSTVGGSYTDTVALTGEEGTAQHSGIWSEAGEIHSEVTNTRFTGTQVGTNTFTTDSGTVHCTTATFSATSASTTTTELLLTPTYGGCRSTGFIEADGVIDANNCQLRLTASGQVHLTGCTNASKSMIITLPFCTIETPEQILETVSFSNTGSGTTREMNLALNITNATYKETGFACKNSGASTVGGQYSGSIRITGEKPPPSHSGIWSEAGEIHSEVTNTRFTGAQVGTNTFTTDSGTVHCSTATFSATSASTTTTELLLTPTYGGCRSTGFIEADGVIDANNCRLRLTASGQVHLTGCTNASKSMIITLPFCTIETPEQTLETVSFSNTGSGTTREMNLALNITNATYKETGFACKNSGASTVGGQYSGSIRFTGELPRQHFGVAIDSTSAGFHSEVENTFVEGGAAFSFVTDSGTIACSLGTNALFIGKTTTDLKLSLSFSSCSASGFVEPKIVVDVNECRLTLTSSGLFYVSGCTNTGKSIAFTITPLGQPGCTIELTEQPLEGVDFAQLGVGTTRLLTAGLTGHGVRYQESGGSCKNVGPVETGSGELTSDIVLTGRTSAFQHVGIWRE